MTPRLRIPLIGVAVVLALLVGACAKPGGQQQQNAANGSGEGQLGEAPAGGLGPGAVPDPVPTVPSDVPAAPAPTTLPVPPAPVLPWPSPPDCISHSPANVTILTTSGLWQIVDGSHALLAYKTAADAQAGLALAKAYKQHCFIGRNNTRTDRENYIIDYWLSPVMSSPAITAPDCLSHDPALIKAVDRGSLGWGVQAGPESISIFDTKADADQAVLVYKHFNRHCYIGRDYSGADRRKYITTWFATV
jgi:hypothetical protein